MSKIALPTDLEKLLFSNIVKKLGYVRQIEVGVIVARLARKLSAAILLVRDTPERFLPTVTALEATCDALLKNQKV